MNESWEGNRETEKQSDRETENHKKQSYLRAREKNDTNETHEVSRLFTQIETLQDAARIALSDKSNGDPVFKYARAVKAFEMTRDARLSKKELSDAFRVWWDMAQSSLPTGADYDEYRLTFMEAYEKAKTPLGANVIETALARVASSPTPPEASRYDSAKIKRLVHLCRELQTLAGDNPFFLSVRDAARAIDCPRHETAAVFLKGLVRDGILTLVSLGKAGGRQASRFKFNFSSSETE